MQHSPIFVEDDKRLGGFWAQASLLQKVGFCLLFLLIVFAVSLVTEPVTTYAYSPNTPDEIGFDKAEIGREGECTIVYKVSCRNEYFEFDPDAGGVDGRIIARVFSATVCNVEQLIGEVFGHMWCAISQAVVKPLTALITLYIAILGLMFVMGMVRMTLGEVSKRILMLVLVWAFVTNADFALDIMFMFAVTALREGVDIVLTQANFVSSGNVVSEQVANVESISDAIYNLDEAAESIFGGPEDEGVTFIAGALALLSAPGGAVLGPMLLAEALFSFFVFVQAVLAYLVSITGMVFLMTLSPIFISFALFQPTKTLFEKWLKHIISYALQPPIIFAYLILMENYVGGVKNAYFDPEVFNSQFVQYDTADPAINQNLGPMTILQSFYELNVNACAGPDCETVSPDGDWTKFAGDFQTAASQGLEPTIIGAIALLILDFVTMQFLAMVPEIARQITNAPRVLKLGGGEEHWKGAALTLPGGDMYQNMLSGAKNAAGSGDAQAVLGSAIQGGTAGWRRNVERGFNSIGQTDG